MEIPPVYWTLLGEIALILIGVLATVIIVVLKDRKKLKEYSHYLKDVIKKLKKKLAQHESEQSQERILELLNGLIEHVREQYQVRFGNTLALNEESKEDDESEEDADKADDLPSVEKFVFIAGFQTIIAELSALENSNDPDVTWTKIQNELTPLFQNYLDPILSEQKEIVQSISEDTDDENLKAQLENSNKRIENLEKFKQLYFDLQSKLSNSVAEIEGLNQQISDLAEGSDKFDDIRQLIEKNKTHYLEMGQMIGMDKEQHHSSVANSMDYSDAIINERKDEIKRLKSQIAQQFEDIWKLQNRASDSAATPPSSEELSSGIETISRNLKDAEMCIETMDMEIQTLTSEITNLRNQLKEQSDVASPEQKQALEEKEAMIARFSQESKELMSCITGLEDDNQSQNERIKELEKKLVDGSDFKEKYLKLEAEYSNMESKYLEAMSK
ncbi:MAG: hypothetical protein OQL19_05790 [Gammaproteobacteria bacterium]|nr:hypothetical protein [Gammaproteobacteria bacterium]